MIEGMSRSSSTKQTKQAKRGRTAQTRTARAARAVRAAYESDLNDAEWEMIKEIIPAPKPGGRPAKYERREIVNAILYINKAGCVWRLMPHDLPPFRSVHNYFSSWRDEGIWQQVLDTLRRELRTELGRHPEPSAAVMDTQSVKTTEKGGLQDIEAMMQARR
jgi:putative transposase